MVGTGHDRLWGRYAVAGAALIDRPPVRIRAPGRVNLIGEHTDYNDGFVMPMAIDRYTEVNAVARDDGRLCLSSDGFAVAADYPLSSLRTPSSHLLGDPAADAVGEEWTRYVRAVAWALQDAGYALSGADLRIRSNVPVGSGLSSSAALEVACAAALLRIAGRECDLTTLARLCQHAETEYVGMRCGIMDQYIACHGCAQHALLLDCRTLAHRQVPMLFSDADARVVVCNSMVRHSHAGGEYNQRRAQCEAGVRHLSVQRAGIRALRDVTLDEFAALATGMEALVLRRCRHVIGENARVLAAAAALEAGDAGTFGELMYASHQSMRDDYECSCAELDLLVELARAVEGVYGARMTGGGFGGCTVSLVRADAVPYFERSIAAAYRAATGKQPQIFVCAPSDGVAEVIGAGK